MMIYFMINQTKKSLCQKIETVQYSAALAITIAIKDVSQIKLYNELGFYNLLSLNGGSENCLFYKIKKTGLQEYIFNMVPQRNHQYKTRSIEDVTFYCKTDVFKCSNFPHTNLQWDKLGM